MPAISTPEPATSGDDTLALLREMDVFADLSDEEFVEIGWTLSPFTCDAGTQVFRQGDPADHLLCILQGRVRIEIRLPGEHASMALHEIGPNEVVGEPALMHGDQRSVTATAIEPVVGYRVQRLPFEAIRAVYRPSAFKVIRRLVAIASARGAVMAEELRSFGFAERTLHEVNPNVTPPAADADAEKSLDEFRGTTDGLAPVVLRALPIFDSFAADELGTLLGDMYLLDVPQGRVIFDEGDPPMACYIVVRGAVQAYLDRGARRWKLGLSGPGSMFGDAALFSHSARTASCITRERSILLGMDREHFDEKFSRGSLVAYKLFDEISAELSEDVRRGNRRLAWFRLNAGTSAGPPAGLGG